MDGGVRSCLDAEDACGIAARDVLLDGSGSDGGSGGGARGGAAAKKEAASVADLMVGCRVERFGWGGTESIGLIRSEFRQDSVRNH